MRLCCTGLALLVLWASLAAADVFSTYESFEEGFLGTGFSDNGVTYRDANLESGVFPDGSTFTSEDLGSEFIIENATFFYNDFPEYGSPIKCLTFGRAFVPGDNLSIGVLSSVWMDLDENGQAASLDVGFYENGPWGGIEYHLDGLLNDEVVASDSFIISDLGGRDNPTFATLAIDGAEFDTLHLYATFDGQFSAPRGIVDNLDIIAASSACDGDVNGDGVVDLADLATLLSNFGTSSGATREMGDLDGDADIDLADLASLLANFGASCP